MKEHEAEHWQNAKTKWTDWKDEEPKGKHVYQANVKHGSDMIPYHVSKEPLSKHHLKKLDKRAQKEHDAYMSN